jgi:hypothetical protein
MATLGKRFTQDGVEYMAVPEFNSTAASPHTWSGCDGCIGHDTHYPAPPGLAHLSICSDLDSANPDVSRGCGTLSAIFIRTEDKVAYITIKLEE